jgi:hypothetical protein
VVVCGGVEKGGTSQRFTLRHVKAMSVKGIWKLFKEALQEFDEVLRDCNLEEAMEPNSQTSEVHRSLTLFRFA